MKKIIALIITAFVFASCSKDNDNNAQFNVSKIAGKWQYVEELDYNPPGPYVITNGPIVDVNADGTFTSNQNSNYPHGIYTVSTDSIISLNYISNSDTFTKKQKITFYSANELILDNDYSGSGACIEGCGERYAKIIAE